MARKPVEQWPALWEDADVSALQALVNDPIGKRALDWIINGACDTYGRSASESPHDTYFHEGRRDVGRQIVHLLKLNLNAIAEARKRAEQVNPKRRRG